MKRMLSVEVYIDEEGDRYVKVPDDLSIAAFLRPLFTDCEEEALFEEDIDEHTEV